MAYVYCLSTECGPDKKQAESLAAHFEDYRINLATGHESRCSVGLVADERGNWWADIYPDHITRANGASLKDAIEVSEVGFHLYTRLKTATPFRFALFGCEVMQFRQYCELADDIIVRHDGTRCFDSSSAFDGLVLSKAVWESLGKPIAFWPFAEQYLWRLYHGLQHQVAGDDTEYGQRLRKLRDGLYPKWQP
jgi:hypothetical protein